MPATRVALITGGATGIGLTVTRLLAKSGAAIVVSGRNASTGEKAVEELRASGADAIFLRADVRDDNDVRQLIAGTIAKYGRLDLAFNNSGVEGEGVPLVETTMETWNSVMDTNLKGVWLCMKYQIPQMLKQGSGSIVNTSSVLGSVANRSALYTASKHGVNGLTKSAALTYAKNGIRINAVCPGYIDTDMVKRAYATNPAARESAISRHPIGRLGSPEEVAAAVIWLFSDAASFVTGHLMTVDGGYTVP